MRNQIKTWILLGTPSVIFIGIGGMFGESYMIGFAVMALTINFAAYRFSDRMCSQTIALVHGRQLTYREPVCRHCNRYVPLFNSPTYSIVYCTCGRNAV